MWPRALSAAAIEPSVQVARVRQADRAGRVGLSVLADAPSVFIIEATARPGHTAEEIETAVEDELADSATTRAEPSKSTARATGRNADCPRPRTLGGFGGVADRLNEYNHYVGDPGSCRRTFERYREVTPASVKAFAAQLTPTRASLSRRCQAAGTRPELPKPPRDRRPAPAAKQSTRTKRGGRSRRRRGRRPLQCQCRHRSRSRTA